VDRVANEDEGLSKGVFLLSLAQETLASRHHSSREVASTLKLLKMKEHQEFKKQLAEINQNRALEQDRKRKQQRPNQSGK
jgi:hypothetical protein